MFNREQLAKKFKDFHLKNKIDLEKCGITLLERQTFSGLTNLTDLNLKLNKLYQLPKGLLSGLFNLKQIDLSANDLDQIDRDTFNGLISLRSIDLFHNQLKHLDKDIFNGLINLNRIDLSSNQLKQIDNNIFKGLANLTQIDLSKNELQYIDETTFRGLNNLKIIDLSNNKLTKIHKDTFKGLFNLTHIYLNNNEFNTNRLELVIEKNVQFVSFKNDRNENNYDSILRQKEIVSVETNYYGKCKWINEVVEELDHLLRNKMINHDIKPAVIVLKEGEVELKDYGDDKKILINMPNTQNGTPFYIIKMMFDKESKELKKKY